LPEAAWVYYSSLGKGHESLETSLLGYLQHHPDTRLTFNPGTHQLRRGLKALRPVIKRSEVFIVNKEEAELLLACEATPVPDLLEQLHAYGAKTTCGRCPGVYAMDDEALALPYVSRQGSGTRTGRVIVCYDVFLCAFFITKRFRRRYGMARLRRGCL
jgi:sugar/nucleoside kinase (ribokinase family)